MSKREILFKAKSKATGDWVNGYYVFAQSILCRDNVHVMFDGFGLNCEVEINQDTLCQYIGMVDKNGEKIYEGDIMEFDAYGKHYVGDVRIIDGNACVYCDKCAPFLNDAIKKRGAVRIGNIYDNTQNGLNLSPIDTK